MICISKYIITFAKSHKRLGSQRKSFIGGEIPQRKPKQVVPLLPSQNNPDWFVVCGCQICNYILNNKLTTLFNAIGGRKWSDLHLKTMFGSGSRLSSGQENLPHSFFTGLFSFSFSFLFYSQTSFLFSFHFSF